MNQQYTDVYYSLVHIYMDVKDSNNIMNKSYGFCIVNKEYNKDLLVPLETISVFRFDKKNDIYKYMQILSTLIFDPVNTTIDQNFLSFLYKNRLITSHDYNLYYSDKRVQKTVNKLVVQICSKPRDRCCACNVYNNIIYTKKHYSYNCPKCTCDSSHYN